MSNGWIKIHRQILEWEWYDDVNTFKLFMHLLIMANHKERRYKGILIKKGQVMTGQDVLAKQTNLSRQNVRTSLERLKSTNEVTIKSNKQGTIIQLVNYGKYQVLTNDLTNIQPTANQLLTTNKNVKKEKNIKPTWDEFLKYSLEKKPYIKKDDLRYKYDSWVENGWKDGNDKEIVNWKTKLLNTLPYINEIKNKPQQFK